MLLQNTHLGLWIVVLLGRSIHTKKRQYCCLDTQRKITRHESKFLTGVEGKYSSIIFNSKNQWLPPEAFAKMLKKPTKSKKRKKISPLIVIRHSIDLEKILQNSWTTCTTFWIMNRLYLLTGFVSYADQAQFCSSLWNMTRPQIKLIYAAGYLCCLLRWYVIMPWAQILYLLSFLSFVLLKFYKTRDRRKIRIYGIVSPI